MKQYYCGNYWSLRTGLVPVGDGLKILFDNNVPVRYRHVWSHILGQGTITSEWMEAQTIIDLNTTGKKPDVPDAWKYTYRMEISYEIPDEIYPVVLAKLAEKSREYDEHWNRVMARQTPEWAMSEAEQGYIYSTQIAPEREVYNTGLYDLHGEMRI